VSGNIALKAVAVALSARVAVKTLGPILIVICFPVVPLLPSLPFADGKVPPSNTPMNKIGINGLFLIGGMTWGCFREWLEGHITSGSQ
jgi:hypothetical protein